MEIKKYTYKGQEYEVNLNRPILTEKDQHHIEKGFIDGMLLVEQYNQRNKK